MANLLDHMNSPIPFTSKSGIKCDRAIAQNKIVRNPAESGGTYEEQMAYLVSAVRANQGRILGMMTINPFFDVENALRLADKYVREGIIVAVKLHPRIHNFRVDEEQNRLSPILEWAAKARTIVHIHTGDPFSEPSRIEPIAESHRDVNFVMCHMATQMISYNPEAFVTVKHNPNTYLEIGFHEKRLREGVKMLGAEKFLFATDCPMNDIGTGISIVHALHDQPPFGMSLSESDVELILSGNAMRLMRLPKPRDGDGDVAASSHKSSSGKGSAHRHARSN